MNKLKYSASVLCANLARLEEDLQALEAAGCDELDFTIMDGLFAPGFGLGAETIKAAGSVCGMPCNAHLMVVRPEEHVERFVEAGCDSISIHAETCTHAHRVLNQIREAGASPGIALNPATSLTKLDYLLEGADRVRLLAVDPGSAGREVFPSAFQRARILRENIKYRRLKTIITVDGGMDVESAAHFAQVGAGMLVLGRSALFKGARGEELGAAFKEFSRAVQAARATV